MRSILDRRVELLRRLEVELRHTQDPFLRMRLEDEIAQLQARLRRAA